MRRLPARERRWRRWSPEEASRGAVPFQDGEVAGGGEPADVADVAEEAGGAGGADRRAGCAAGCRWPRPVVGELPLAVLIFCVDRRRVRR